MEDNTKKKLILDLINLNLKAVALTESIEVNEKKIKELKENLFIKKKEIESSLINLSNNINDGEIFSTYDYESYTIIFKKIYNKLYCNVFKSSTVKTIDCYKIKSNSK